jgi:hypothetical protein
MTSISVEDGREKHIQHSIWFRLVQVLWFALALVAVGVILASLPGYWQGIVDGVFFQETPTTSDLTLAMDLIADLTSMFAVVVSFLLAVLLFWRKADDLMALSLSFFLLAYSVILAGPMEILLDIYGLPFDIYNFASAFLLTVPLMAFAFLFPNGHFVPGWTRWILVVAIISFLLLFSIPNDQWFTTSSSLSIFVTIIFATIQILGIYAQVYRYRNVSSYSEKQQTKWVLFGLWLFLSSLILAAVMAEFIPIDSISGVSRAGWESLTTIIWWLSFCILPVTIFIAIQRHSLWDIDLIIRKTLVYGALTLLIVVAYFGSVVLLQQAFRALTGQDSPVAIVISTLIIAALFNPLRVRVQETIDRRFYRHKYDAQQALAEFAATARDEVEMDQLTEHLLSVVQESMQPEQTTLWLVATPTTTNIKSKEMKRSLT